MPKGMSKGMSKMPMGQKMAKYQSPRTYTPMSDASQLGGMAMKGNGMKMSSMKSSSYPKGMKK